MHAVPILWPFRLSTRGEHLHAAHGFFLQPSSDIEKSRLSDETLFENFTPTHQL